MTTAGAIRKLIVEHVEAENARDPERVMATYGDDCVFELALLLPRMLLARVRSR